MRTINFTEFRNNASMFLSEVEKGEIVIILKHGKPIAQISPPKKADEEIPSWKRAGLRLITSGEKLSSAILEERDIS